MATKQQIAAWALRSYPDAGDAAFIVHGGRVTGGMAREFMESLRSYFVARPYVRALGSALREAKGQAATSSADQELAAQIWKEHAESFLKDMYAAHDDGRVLFGQTYDTPGHVEAWVKRKGYVAKKNPRRRNPAKKATASATLIEGLKEMTEYNHHAEALVRLSVATDVAASGKLMLTSSDLSDLTRELEAIRAARDDKGYMDEALRERSYAAYKKLMAKAKRVYTAASYKKIHDAL